MDVPYNIFNYRREQCAKCPTPCQFQNDLVWRRNGDNACPAHRFTDYRLYKKVKWTGAGDMVAAVAQPIAGAIDKVFNTKVKTCGGCAKRREMLNQLIPF